MPSRTKPSAVVDRVADQAALCCDLAPQPMVLIEGPLHVVRYANPAYQKMVGQPAEQIVGKPFDVGLAEKSECETLIDRVLRTGTPESHGTTADKVRSLLWSYTAWPVRLPDGLVGVMLQVTETAQFHALSVAMTEALVVGAVRQHELIAAAAAANAQLTEEVGVRTRAEAALQLAQAQLVDRAGQLEDLVSARTKELQEANQNMETFVYSIAHDLRAPLRSMQGFASLLTEEMDSLLSESGRDYARRINASAHHMGDMVRDLLDFSRVSQQEIQLQPVRLETVVDVVIERLQTAIDNQAARIESIGPWPIVLAHEPTLIQVVFNLLSNALKFAAPGVPAVVRVRPEVRDGKVRVWIEDNGIGIPAGDQGQIFGLFTRLHHRSFPGTGIGLAIVQRGITRMGGTVGVESILGQGSRFWFELRTA